MTCFNCGMPGIQNWTPVNWSNQPLVVYHGTIDVYAQNILQHVRVAAGSQMADFGQGFYTTTVLQQAITWAEQKRLRSTRGHPQAAPAVLEFKVDRNRLASLSSLCFVRGHFNAEEYWSFIWHCRKPGGAGHHFYKPDKKTAYGLYDVVSGPINAMWTQRIATYDGDQISFHTQAAENLLNNRHQTSIKRVI